LNAPWMQTTGSPAPVTAYSSVVSVTSACSIAAHKSGPHDSSRSSSYETGSASLGPSHPGPLLLLFRLVLQRQLGGIGRLVLGERLEDLRPEAGLAPAVIATVHRFPRAEVRRHIAPGGSGARHPEHAGEHGAMVVRGTTRGRLLRREQRRDARPPRVGQV